MPRVVAVVGSRNFQDFSLFTRIMRSHIGPEDELISGGARGVDTWAKRWARSHNMKYRTIKAKWEVYGKAAGPKRNTVLVNSCDAILAFWDGKSAGTQDVIRKANRAQKSLFVIMFTHQEE